MAADEHPPIFDMALQGWRLAFAAFSRMPAVIGIGMLVVFALSVASLPLLPGPKEELSLAIQLLSLLLGFVQGFLLTPVAIAVHRFVLLGEIARYYSLTPSQPRFMRFFLFTVVFQLLTIVPATLMSFGKEGGIGVLIWTLAAAALFIAAVIASLRLLILFPAIAVDARGADWRNAMADTKGHTWRVFFIVVLTSLPALVVTMPLYFTLSWPDAPGLIAGLFLSFAQSVVGVLSLAAFAAIASRLFAIFANRLNG
jgi:hypothetical protein